jgi:CRP-like cAMP-binding protein
MRLVTTQTALASKNRISFGLSALESKRQELLIHCPGFDIFHIENAAHYFDKNVFKYIFAGLLAVGTVFGELGILNGRKRSATIAAMEDTYLAVLTARDYKRILESL